MLLNLYLLNSTPQSLIKADLPVNSFVFLLLSLLLTLSLISQFYSKASPVHKVIALLLLSVLAVLLWVYETQFLFIYLVYILAFVGAVLMLFLSVVLMLPISTTSTVSNLSFLAALSSSSKWDIISSHSNSFDARQPLYLSLNSLWSHKVAALILFLIFVITFNLALVALESMLSSTKPNFNQWLEEFSFVLTARCSGADLSSFSFSKSANPLLQLWGQTSASSNTPFRFASQDSRVLSLFARISPSMSNLVEHLYNQLVVIETLIYGFFRYYFYSFLRLSVVSLHAKLIHIGSSISSFSHHLVESLVSAYLLLNMFILVVPSVLPSTSNTHLLDVSFSGLSEIRALLYDNFGWFLLLSTVVLLVALFGVAVITRNKK